MDETEVLDASATTDEPRRPGGRAGAPPAPATRLVHITSIAGTQRVLLRGQNAYMAARGFEVHAVASPDPDLDRLAERDGVVAHPVPITREISPLRDLRSLVRLVVVLRRIRPAIAQVSTPKGALLGAIAAWIARVPVRIFLIRGLLSSGARGRRRALYRGVERLTARLCHRTICVSPSLLEYARDGGIVGPGRGAVLAGGMSNGVDPAHFDPGSVAPAPRPAASAGPDGAVIGFVGRLVGDKGLVELNEAWRTLRDEFPTASLLLVGPWEGRDAVPDHVRAEWEADPRVVLTGAVTDVAPYYRAMDLFVFPSYREGFPNAPMEAACMGLPVVTTTATGCRDAVVDGETGTLVPPRDAGALTEAIRAYLRDPDLRRCRGEAGRARVLRDFRREVIWEALYREYVRLLEAAGQPVPSPAAGAGTGEDRR